MLTILGRASSSNVAKVVWTCEELKLAYDRKDIGGEFGGNDRPEYLALNPNGVVPTIDDDGFILWESNSIVRYLARKHGMGSLCPVEPRIAADAERWMDWQLTTLLPAFAPLYVQFFLTPHDKRDRNVINQATERTAQVLSRLDSNLAQRGYVAGDQLTIGDLPFGPVVHRWFNYDIARPVLPNLEAWYMRLSARDAFKKAIPPTL